MTKEKNFDLIKRGCLLTQKELGDLFDRNLSFAEIARRSGVSRERIRQIYRKYFAEGRILKNGREISTVRTKARHEKMREEKTNEDEMFNFVRMKAREQGMEVGWISALSSGTVGVMKTKMKVNGRVCGIRWCGTTFAPGAKSKRKYWRAHLRLNSIERVEFLILVLGGEDREERVLVIPKKEVIGYMRGKERAMLYVPEDDWTGYNGVWPKVDWLSYEEAWHLLNLK